MSGRVARAYFGLDLRLPFVARGLELILGLNVDPIVRGRVEVASETQGSLARNPGRPRYRKSGWLAVPRMRGSLHRHLCHSSSGSPANQHRIHHRLRTGIRSLAPTICAGPVFGRLDGREFSPRRSSTQARPPGRVLEQTPRRSQLSLCAPRPEQSRARKQTS